MLFNVAILTQSTTRKIVSSRSLFWNCRVRAANRTEALTKCLPEIRKKVLPSVDVSIKFVSVFVGRKGSVSGSAFRLVPIQIVRENGEIR